MHFAVIEAGEFFMKDSNGKNFRTVFYERYVSSGQARISGGNEKSFLPFLKKIIRDHLPSNLAIRILELGCGGGELLSQIREAGYSRIRGIDLSAEQVARAHQRGLQDLVERGDALRFLACEGDASYDVLIAIDVIEHLSKDEVLQFITESRRILAPGGRLIIHVPNGDSPFCGSIRYCDITHELAFTPKSVHQLALTAGFSSVKCYEDRPIPHGIKSSIRAMLWPFCRSILIFMTAVETGVLDRKSVYSRTMFAVIERT
jgi:2-polyprenyl-3-methyl-5-hydroxy-6-metoxy-1,4-benzoquinol methylase